MRVLVTGASGFVGRWAVKTLVERGIEVYAASRGTPAWGPSVTAITGDLLDPRHIRTAVETARPDAILHLAWTVEHGKFWTSIENIDWVAATASLVRTALDMDVARFVGVGTCYEYGWPDDANCDETLTPIEPRNLYAAAKDAVRRVLAELGTLSFAWARLFYLFGPYEHEQRLVASLVRRLALNEPAPLSSGMAIRDFMDVRDAGRALASLVASDARGAINIATGTGVSVASLADRLGRISGRSNLLRYRALPDRLDEPPRIVASVKRLREEVGFVPTHSLDEGLADAYCWWCNEVEGRR